MLKISMHRILYRNSTEPDNLIEKLLQINPVIMTKSINGADSSTKSNKNPPNGYPIKTPVAIPPNTSPIILDLSSSSS